MIKLEIAICDQRRSYFVTFATEDQAIDFLARRTPTAIDIKTGTYGNHAWFELENEPIPATCTRLLEVIYPTCSHGMSAELCEGPEHFLSAAQEREPGW
jgi:hypothetical protein